jgi:hypothetical protein
MIYVKLPKFIIVAVVLFLNVLHLGQVWQHGVVGDQYRVPYRRDKQCREGNSISTLDLATQERQIL